MVMQRCELGITLHPRHREQRWNREQPIEHRHVSTESGIPRAIHLSHAAPAAQLNDFVGSQASAWLYSHYLAGLYQPPVQ